jgi:sugar phosphate isomerase/epimerase
MVSRCADSIRAEENSEMGEQDVLFRTNRRNFLNSACVTAAAMLVSSPATGADSSTDHSSTQSSGSAGTGKKKNIPLGVFDPVYDKLSLDEMLDKVSALGLEAMEIGTGGYPGSHHCPVAELLADPAKARAWKKKFEDRNIRVATFSSHGNPIHPDPQHAARDAEAFRNTVLLAERMDVPVVVGFSGCPGGTPTDTQPNWITYRWPPEYAQMLDWQWKEKVVPYWKEATKFARQHGIKKIGLEMHPNFVVYNPKTLLRLREAAGEEIGANCDLSHLFWQGCDPVAAIHFLAANNALYHAHMKDTVLFPENVAKYGVLNFAFTAEELPDSSDTFRAVGYGHGASTWKAILQAYMDVDYQGILSIENEDPILTGEVGVERAAYVLKNVRNELLA